MPRGGSRPNSGRKKGSPNKMLAEIRDKAVKSGITPIEILLKWMRAADEAGDPTAVQYASMAAPYVHPRLSTVTATATVEHKGEDGSQDVRRLAMFMLHKLRAARESGITLDLGLEAIAPGTPKAAQDDER